MSAAPDPQTLPAPPHELLELATLFLDFDGTLVDLVDNPGAVAVDDELEELLTHLTRRHGSRLAIISGRSIAQLDTMLGPLGQFMALAGSHGSEYRWDGQIAHPARPESLDIIELEMLNESAAHTGSLVEAKSFGVALHYRLAPHFEPEALAIAERLADKFGLTVQKGKMMAEVRVPGSDKGVALETMMRRPEMQGTRPVFIGDDITDEHAFAAAKALGGVGILVGPARETAADYGLADPAAVRRWLWQNDQ